MTRSIKHKFVAGHFYFHLRKLSIYLIYPFVGPLETLMQVKPDSLLYYKKNFKKIQYKAVYSKIF